MRPLPLVLATSFAMAAAAAAALGVHAQSAPAAEPPSADLLPDAAQRRLASVPPAPKAGIAAAPPTLEEVGDVDSFGRSLRWLGVTQMNITLADACDDPAAACAVLSPSPAATAFQFEDVARIVLPPKASHSMLCYWLSPFHNVTYSNPGAAPVVARLRYSPTLTVENTVLDDPALIDPTTGLPFGGRLTTGMTASESFELPLPAGTTVTQRTRDSAVCIAGFLTRRALVDTYGLTEAQAKEFFKRRTTVRMNLVGGQAQYVSNASMVFGFRIIGD
jgi:hypothetical protein